MKIIDLNKYQENKIENQNEVITWENVKQYSNSKLLDTLQDFIDYLEEEEQYSDGWNFFRNFIDHIIGILDERLKD
jgi:site-specific DNA-cytosine methylase